MEQLIPIGRFSRLTRLSIRALRNYDGLGLLRPAEVDASTGYRYYQLSQTWTAEAIRLLRSVDLSLDDIATILADPTDGGAVGRVLDHHRQRLEDSVRTQQRRLATVQRLITGEEHLMPNPVTTQTLPDQAVAVIGRRANLTTLSTVLPEAFGALYGSLTVAPTGPAMVLYHDIMDEAEEADIELAVPIADAVDLAGEVSSRVLAGGAVASTVHQGAYADIGLAYAALTTWFGEHGHTPAFPAREVYLNDPSQNPEEELLTEIHWPFD